MATTRIRSQVSPPPGSNVNLYTTPTATDSVISSIVVCNRSSAPDNFRIMLRDLGNALADKHYLYYDVPIPGNDTFIATIGVVMQATDVLDIYSANGTCTFQAYLQENS